MLPEQLVGLSQEILWLSGPRLSPASEPGAEEGQGQGPGRMYRNSVPCTGRQGGTGRALGGNGLSYHSPSVL